jgi:alpha-galactosidase
MNIIVEKIVAASMTPGLWMAPFTCDTHSQLGKDHPDWILKRKAGFLDFKGEGHKVPANSANCGKWFWGLDVTNPEVSKTI